MQCLLGSSPGSIISLIFVNDLQHSKKFLDPMFADNTNLFYSNSNINEIFENVYKELLSPMD